MQLWLRFLLITAIVFSVSSFVWFLLGSTAYFQRSMDIIGTTIFFGAGIPVLLFAILFAILLIKGRTPTNKVDFLGMCVWLVLSTLLSIALIQNVNTHGWSNEKIESDSLKITADKKYEYRIDLINLFQKNSRARLYLKDVSSGEEKYIPIDIQTRRIVVLSVGEVNHWVILEPTNNSSRYILHTTEELGIPEERFQVNIIDKNSRILK